ncbi:Adenylate cyclase [Yarrowia sp. B02]|nr:Adenylate cyclase [Yarrowia sp. B02]
MDPLDIGNGQPREGWNRLNAFSNDGVSPTSNSYNHDELPPSPTSRTAFTGIDPDYEFAPKWEPGHNASSSVDDPLYSTLDPHARAHASLNRSVAEPPQQRAPPERPTVITPVGTHTPSAGSRAVTPISTNVDRRPSYASQGTTGSTGSKKSIPQKVMDLFVSDDTSADSDTHSASSKKHKVKLPRPSKSMFFFKKHDDDDARSERSEHSRDRAERTSHPGEGHQLRAARSFNKPEQGIFHKAATSNHFDEHSIHRAASHSTLPSGDEDDTLVGALAHKAKKSSKNIIGKVFHHKEKKKKSATFDGPINPLDPQTQPFRNASVASVPEPQAPKQQPTPRSASTVSHLDPHRNSSTSSRDHHPSSREQVLNMISKRPSLANANFYNLDTDLDSMAGIVEDGGSASSSGLPRHASTGSAAADSIPGMPVLPGGSISGPMGGPMAADRSSVSTNNVDSNHTSLSAPSAPPANASGNVSAPVIGVGTDLSFIGNDDTAPQTNAGQWSAPESWAVADTGPGSSKLEPEEVIETYADPTREQYGLETNVSTHIPGKPPMNYFVRIFRQDDSFGTIVCPLETTVSELIQILGKKFFLPSVKGYQLCVRIGGLTRVLDLLEKPLLYQKILLEFMGYTEKDRLVEVGREDLSYLCRFLFLPSSIQTFTPEEEAIMSRDYVHADLQNLELQTIPIIFYQFSNEIEYLDVSNNPSISIPLDFIQSCINLKNLRFSGNRSRFFPVNISHAVFLEYLDMSRNMIKDVSQIRFERMSALTTLDLSCNQLTRINNNVALLKQLRRLSLSNNNVTDFPMAVCNLPNLIELDLSFNRLSSVPASISKLVNLERLVLNNNYISKLPNDIKSLVQLKELDVRYNRLNNVDALSSLPLLEVLYASKNQITSYEHNFESLQCLYFDRNPFTEVNVSNVLHTLTVLHLSKAKLSTLPDNFFDRLPNLEKLVLDKNHFVSLPSSLGSLRKLIYLSAVGNNLSVLPSTIGQLTTLQFLDLHSNNLRKLPDEIWNLNVLSTLNVSSNLLDSFPKHKFHVSSVSSGDAFHRNLESEFDSNYEMRIRRPSAFSITSTLSPGETSRRGSLAYSSPKMSASPMTFARDAPVSSRTTLANSLLILSLADNRLNDECFEELSLLTSLQVLNLSYNELMDIPYGALRRLNRLTELYLSGNNLTSLPADDFENIKTLRTLHVNGNKLHSLPAELGKILHLTVLDVSSNQLKYNISNWPYDWNWNWNLDLKYLSFSGNKRLEIKSAANNLMRHGDGQEQKNLSDFTVLSQLRILGLMDVTLTTPSVPDQTENCRVRTYGSELNNMPYGMADSLGQHDNLSIIDMVVERFRGNENEVIVGMFDGRNEINPRAGNKVAKLLQEMFGALLQDELKKMRDDDTIEDALKRSFLAANRDIGAAALTTAESHTAHRSSTTTHLNKQDGLTGSCATVCYISDNKLYVANVGDSMCILSKGTGEHRLLTTRHDPTEPEELGRVRAGGGFISAHGKLDGVCDVSRAFGFYNLIPHIQARPDIVSMELNDSDELLIIGSKQLWEVMSYETAVDIARTESQDPMLAAAKLRDFAISYGASDKLMVMVLGIGVKRRSPNQSNLISGLPPVGEDELFQPYRKRRDKSLLPEDSNLARLGSEVDPPEGEMAMVFTDIKNSTLLWETYPIAMRSAIKIHNAIMRRQLRILRGYEVKTEGDAFMVSFTTPTSALLWCFSVQQQLLAADWPAEILESEEGYEVRDDAGNVVFRGLSVRMGIHWGSPVCEPDPITRRMDYFGPMVNRAARVSAVADGGQITVSADFISKVKKLQSLREKMNSEGVSLGEAFNDEITGQAITQNLDMLDSLGWIVKEIGELKLKGLENPEFLSLVYSAPLAARHGMQEDLLHPKKKAGGFTSDLLSQVLEIALRLEHICARINGQSRPVSLKDIQRHSIQHIAPTPESELGVYFENIVTRIENAIMMLCMRHTVARAGGFDPINIDNVNTSASTHGVEIGQLLDAIAQLTGIHYVPEGQAVDRGVDRVEEIN